MQSTRPLQKTLVWYTTQAKAVDWARPLIERGVDLVPALAAKAHGVHIAGDAHATTKADGTVDPLHCSGVLYSMSKKKITAFHLYPDGTLNFSKGNFGAVVVPTNATLESVAGSQSAQQQAPQVEQALVWKVENNVPKYWDGSTWITAQYFPERQKWMYYYNSTWHYYS